MRAEDYAGGMATVAGLCFFALSAALACSGAQRVPLTPARALCYANADQAAQERADRECVAPDGTPVPFAECPFADDILFQLQQEQEACP